MIDDAELLRRYARHRDESAFRELVERYLGVVYHAAVRQCGGDAHRGQDVAQSVFVDLARKAEQLSHHHVLVGWLYTSARFAAAQSARTESRRRRREQTATLMHELNHAATEPGDDWDQLRPLIDDALHALPERQRDAVLLRFFSQRSFADVGRQLGLSEDAARMQVGRGLARLREILARRGLESTSGVLTAVLSSQASAGVPAALQAAVVESAMAAGVSGGGVAAVLGFMGAFKTAAVIATAVTVAGVVGYQVRSKREPASPSAGVQARLQTVEQKLAAESARAEAAEADNTALLEAIRAARAQPKSPPANETWMTSETLRNRGTATARDAFETFYWALFTGEIKTLETTIALMPPVRAEAEAILAKMTPERRSAYGDAQHFAASLLAGPKPGISQRFQLVREDSGATVTSTGASVPLIYGLPAEAAHDPTYVTLGCKFPLKDGRVSDAFALFQQTGSGWRWVIPKQYLSAAWKRAEQAAAAGRAQP